MIFGTMIKRMRSGGGQHGDKTRNYTSSTKVYVSNVWNYAMDTLDKNPSMDKVWWYTGWS